MPVSVDQFRKLVLDCPEVVAGAHQNHPDFRHGGRVFASIQPDGETVMLKLPLGTQQQLLADHAAFRPASGAWGRAGCTLVALRQIALGELRDAVFDAWQLAAAMTASKHKKK